MMGISWGGFNCLQVAAKQPPALKAVISLCSTVDRYADDIHYKGGCLLNENFGWGSTMLSYSSRPPDPAIVGESWRAMWLERLENEPFLAPRFAAAGRVGRTVGWQLPLGSRRRPASGAGFLLLGDAAGLIDPFTGEGIGNAMFSARRAVAVAVQALAEGDTGAASLARYDDALWAEVGDELAVSARLQRIARCPPLLEFTIRKAARSPRVRDMICAMIANELPRKALTRPAFYFDLLFR